jgi:hypothetical protein
LAADDWEDLGMAGNSVEEHDYLDQYLAILDSAGVKSSQARAFRESHLDMTEVFQNIDQMEAAGRRSRAMKTTVQALWAGTFIMLAGIGLVGFQRGIHLVDAQTQLADARTELGDVQVKFANIEADRTMLAAELTTARNLLQESDVGKLAAKLQMTESALDEAKSIQQQTAEKLAKAVEDTATFETKLHVVETELVAAKGAANEAQALLEKTKSHFEWATAKWLPAPHDGDAPPVAGITEQLSFSQNGQALAAVSSDNVIRIWDLSSGRIVKQEETGDRGHVVTVAGLDGAHWRAVLRLPENQIGLWNLEAGSEVHGLQGPWGEVSACAFSPDGTLLALADAKRLTWILNADRGEAVMPPLDERRPGAAAVDK